MIGRRGKMVWRGSAEFALVVVAILLTGCATPIGPEVVTVPIPEPWTSRVWDANCGQGPEVRSSWDDIVQGVWRRVLEAASADLGAERHTIGMAIVEVVAGNHAAMVCADKVGPVIALSRTGLLFARNTSNPEASLAHMLAHELAHVRLGHLTVAGRQRRHAEVEAEANVLGAYWYGQAGYPCGFLRFQEDCALGQMRARHPLLLRAR